jgi:hypothetical protein
MPIHFSKFAGHSIFTVFDDGASVKSASLAPSSPAWRMSINWASRSLRTLAVVTRTSGMLTACIATRQVPMRSMQPE